MLDRSSIVTGPTKTSTDGRDATATAYVIVVNSLTATLSREIAHACGDSPDRVNEHRHVEVCAATWAAIQAALRISLLSGAQQQVVLKSLDNRLHLHGQESLCAQGGLAGRIGERTSFYLRHVGSRDPVTTAVRIVETLLEATGVPLEKRATQTRLLAGLVAHRIVSDVWLFNDWDSRGKLGLGQPTGI